MIMVLKKYYKTILIAITLLIITFLICMLSPLDVFTFNGKTETDSSVFKYIGWMMAEGQVPYLDTFDHKGLLLYFINYIGYLISPHRGVWVIEILFMFVSVLFSYKIARKFVSKPIALLITLIALAPFYNYFEGGNLTEEYALPLQMISLYIFFDFFLSPKKYLSSGKNYKSKINYKYFNFLVFVCGICFAGVLFLRPNMVSVWLVFGIMVLIYTLAKKKYLELLKFILSFVMGAFVISIPIFIYLIINGAFQSFIDDYILFNLSYTADEGTIAAIALAWNKYFNVPLIVLSFIIVIFQIYKQIKNKESFYFNTGYLIYMFLTFAFAYISGRPFWHYAITIMPIVIYPFCLLYEYLQGIKANNNEIQLIVTIVLIVTFVTPNWLTMFFSGVVDMTNKEQAPYTSDVVNYIETNTDKNDLISVFGNNNIIYNYSHRKSASKYSYQTPIIFVDKKIEKEYFNDLKKNKPKLIISCGVLDEYPDFAKKWSSFLDDNGYKLVLSRECTVYER